MSAARHGVLVAMRHGVVVATRHGVVVAARHGVVVAMRRGIGSRVMVAAALVLGFALLLVLLVRLLENSLIFFPARYPEGNWDAASIGVDAAEHSFHSADGVELFAWFFEAVTAAPDDTPVLLWTHGNGGNLTGRAVHAQTLAHRGMSVFIFDYRGYGKSAGSPTESGIYADAEAAYAYLVGELGVPPRRVVLLGRSLGSAPAARLSTAVEHAGLVLVSPLPSAARMARRMFGGLPVDWLIRARLPVVEWVGERRPPLLLIHGDRDQTIPLEYGLEVFAAAADPKELLVLEGAGHNNVLQAGGELYLDALGRFARRVVAAR